MTTSTLAATPAVARPVEAAAEAAVAPAALPPGGVVDSVRETGWTQGEFSVSEDGAARYDLPLWVPRGRGDVTPELSLSFHSRAGNGPLGVGWSLAGLPSIGPCPKTWAQDGFTDGVRFDGTDMLCLGGNRLMPVGPVSNGTREYRTEQESFAKVVAHGMVNGVPEFFTVFGKDRTILTFGQTLDSRLQAFKLVPGTEPNTLVRESTTTRVTVAWSVNKIEDRNGNAAAVTYERVEGGSGELWRVESRPKSITYAPNREVRFTYETEPRPDQIEAFASGAHTFEPKRLSKVEMFGGPQGGTPERLRLYKLEYQNDSITGRSLLSKITDCDGKDACMLPLPLEWTKGSYEFETIDTDVKDAGQPVLNGNPEIPIDDHRIITGDVNGDGRHDLLYPATDRLLRIHEHQDWRVRLSTGNGFGPPVAAGFTPPTFENPDPHTRNDDTDPFGQVRPIDANLDGQTDVMAWVPQPDGTNKWGLYLSNGSSFTLTSTDLQTASDVNEIKETDPVYFADLNGDGRPEFITAVYDNPNDGQSSELIDGPWHYRLNLANAGPGAQWGPLVNTGTPLAPIHNKGKILHANADGRADFVEYRSDRAAVGWGLNASGQVEERRFAFSPVGATDDGVLEAVSGDVNGDGLPDAISPYTVFRRSGVNVLGQLRGSLNAGTGFGPYSQSPENFWEPRTFCGALPDPGGGEPLPPCDTSKDRGVRYVDFNGDGADDVLVLMNGEPADDDSTGVRLYTWRNGTFVREPLRLSGWDHGSQGFTASQVLDIDGDGMLDIVHPHDVVNPDGGGHLRVLRRKGGMPDQLTGIGDSSFGRRVEVSYTTLADRTVVDGRQIHEPCTEASYPQVCMQSGGSVVASHKIQVSVSSSGGPVYDFYAHTYKGARMDLQGRGWLGFAEHGVLRFLTGERTIAEFDNRSRDTRGTSVYPFVNVPKKVTYTVPNDATETAREFRKTTTHAPEVHRTATGTWFVGPGTVIEVEQERAAGSAVWALLREHRTTTEVDGFGNPRLMTSGTTRGRSTNDDITYDNDTTNWLIGLAKLKKLTSCTATVQCKTRTTEFGYYNNGDPKSTVVEPGNPALELTTTTVYGELGQVESITTSTDSGESRTQTFEYNTPDKLHPTATVNALGHRTQITTHSGLGVPTEVISPNLNETATMVYDRFGRPVQTNRSDGSAESIIRSFDSATSRQRVVTLHSGGSRTQVFLDRLGREIERRDKGFDGRDARVLTGYDTLGRVEKVSRPFFDGATPEFTTTTYDNRDRVTSARAPDGQTVRHEYVNRDTTTIDAKQVRSTTMITVDGDIAARHEDDPDSTAPLVTSFTYGPFAELRGVTAPDNTAQDMRYDTLGQRTSLDDPNAGRTTTTYTPFGEVDTETNAEGEVTDYQYDALGRVTKTTTKDGVAVNNWDTAPNGIGRLVSARSADGVGIDYRYTPQGQPQSMTWGINDDIYKVDYSYDSIGRQSTMTYPAVLGTTSRLKVAHIYNEHGHLSQVKDATGLTGGAITAPCSDDDRAAGRCLWTANQRGADSQLEQETYGNGTVTTNVYRSLTGQLDRTTTVGPGTIGTLAEIRYNYDPNRNVTGRNDIVNGRSEVYGHDELNRLNRWQIPATPGNAGLVANYTYDKAGNLDTETFQDTPDRNVDYGYGTTVDQLTVQPHTLTSRNGSPYTYDKAGRQTGGAGRTIDYTARNLPKTMTWGQNNSNRTEFAYDPDGAQVAKSDNRHAMISIPGILERRAPAGTGGTEVHNIHHVTVEGRVIAEVNRIQNIAEPRGPVTATKTWFLHHDLQGSTHLATTPAGREAGNEEGWLRDLYYDPWGRRIDANNQPLERQNRDGMARIGYTGHNHHDELGLIDMKGRVYDPEARRFTTPDPLIQDPLASQSYNRYAYVWNNPTTHTDPTGFAVDVSDAAHLPNVAWDQVAIPKQDVQYTREANFGSLQRYSTGLAPGSLRNAKTIVDRSKGGSAAAAGQLNANKVGGTSADSDTATRSPASPANTDSAAGEPQRSANRSNAHGGEANPTVGDAERKQPAAGGAGIPGRIKRWLQRTIGYRVLARAIEVEPFEGKGLAKKYENGSLVLKRQAEVIQDAVDTMPDGAGEVRGAGPKKGGILSKAGKLRGGLIIGLIVGGAVISQGCRSGSCTLGVADAVAGAVGSPISVSQTMAIGSPGQLIDAFADSYLGYIPVTGDTLRGIKAVKDYFF